MPQAIHLPYGLSPAELQRAAKGLGTQWRGFGTGGGRRTAQGVAATTLKDMRYVGVRLWETTYGLGMNDCETELETIASFQRVFGMTERMLDVFIGPATFIQTSFSAKWVHYACPQVVMPHTYAAALMSTKVPEDMLDDLEPPWDAFVIQIPSDLLWTKVEDSDDRVPIDAVTVAYKRERTHEGTMREGWSYATISNSSTVSVWRFGIETKDLLLDDLENNPFKEHPLAMPYESEDKALSVLLGRLIVNTILAFQEAGNVKMTKSSRKPTCKPTRKNPPEFRTFKLGKSITLDCRPAIKQYLEDPSGHKGGSPTVRWLVRGHIRNQACGPRHSERKRIWIMPYWKGPEEAPILSRAHEIKVDKNQMTGY
jgi:hypothetical protein